MPTHTLHRFVPSECIAVALMAVLIVSSSGTSFALVAHDDAERDAKQSFQEALEGAVKTYQVRTSANVHRTRRLQELAKEKENLSDVLGEKALIRKKIAFFAGTLTFLESSYGADLAVLDESGALLAQAESYARAERTAATFRQRRDARSVGVHLLARALKGSPAVESAGAALKSVADAQQRRAALHTLLVADAAEASLDALLAQHDELLHSAAQAQEEVDAAEKAVARSDSDMRQIQAIMRDVHAQVLRLQAEMSRIDARVRARAERALIEKGLLPAKRNGATGTVANAPKIQWPVRGRISAGYLDSGYKTRFGVPHEGIDIVVGEGSPVRAAADGVVFLVRDGGDTGYTYILIGHSAGVATLYGHLRSAAVATGQDVNVGQVIGLSGGKPGTPGAGPLTTGPHLHFEVIQNGSNIDPRIVLP